MLGAILGFAGCIHKVDTAAQVAVEAHAEQASASDTDTVERSTRTAGPVDVVTVTEVFGPAAPLPGAVDSANSPATKAPPPLQRRITRTEHRGPVEAEKTRATQAETASTATQATKTTASTTTHSESAPAWHIPLWGFLALLAVGAGIYLFKRFA